MTGKHPLPVVGIPADVRQIGIHPFHAVGEKYINAVAHGSGAMPILFPAFGAGRDLDSLFDRIDLGELIDRLDGLFLPGSPSNVEPQHYDGAPFDADDVVYTINWIADPANGVKTQRNVNWLKSAEKINQYKVRIYLKKPFPAALEFLSGPVVIYPHEYYAKVGPKGMGVKPIGTGPYKVVSVEQGKRFIFERNDNYYGGPKGKASIKRIVIRTIVESNTRLAEMMSGGLDWIWRVNADQAENLKRLDRFTVVNASTMRIGYLGFDASGRTGKTPMTDIRVRKAIAHAIDREGIVKALVKGKSIVVNAACFPTQFGCTDDVAKYDYDPAKSKALLAEAGYPNGFETEIVCEKDPPWELLAVQALVEQWKAVGVKVKISAKPSALYWEVWDKVPFGFTPWTHRPLGVMVLDLAYRTGVPWNESNYSNPEFDRLLTKADGILDVDKRRDVMCQLETIMQEDGPIVQPLWRSVFTGYDKHVLGFKMHPTSYIFANELAIKS